MEKITLWKGSLFKEVSREEIIEKLENAISENQDENKEFSGLLQDIIKRIDCINTIQFYNDGTVRIHYKDGYNQRTPSDFIKGGSAELFNDVIFLDGENRSNDKEENKKMERKRGFFVLENDQEFKFEGLIISMADSFEDTIQIKRGFYDNGQYVQKRLMVIDYIKGTGINNLKDFLTKIVVNDLNFGFQLPEFSITKNAMEFIDNNRF